VCYDRHTTVIIIIMSTKASIILDRLGASTFRPQGILLVDETSPK